MEVAKSTNGKGEPFFSDLTKRMLSVQLSDDEDDDDASKPVETSSFLRPVATDRMHICYDEF
jgi:hypothetical protein